MYPKLLFAALLLIIPLALIAGDPPSTQGPAAVTGDPVSFPDGLKYWDIVAPTRGVAAMRGKRVRVHYTGWLLDGIKFDSSHDAGHPFVFTLGEGQVIPGWEEGLVGMKEGGKRQLRIPPALAYGEKGSPPNIPPDATLIFDIEMLNVER